MFSIWVWKVFKDIWTIFCNPVIALLDVKLFDLGRHQPRADLVLVKVLLSSNSNLHDKLLRASFVWRQKPVDYRA